MTYIQAKYAPTEEEFATIEDEYGQLFWYIAHRMANSNTDEGVDYLDIAQEVRIAAASAISYYKRQAYIEKCFDALDHAVANDIKIEGIETLKDKWHNRTKHGANRQTFGAPEEAELGLLTAIHLPPEDVPDPFVPVDFKGRFGGYLKSICWNKAKQLGKKITKDRILTFIPFDGEEIYRKM